MQKDPLQKSKQEMFRAFLRDEMIWINNKISIEYTPAINIHGPAFKNKLCIESINLKHKLATHLL